MKKFVAVIRYNEEVPIDQIEVKARSTTDAKFLLGFSLIEYVDLWHLVEEYATEGRYKDEAEDN